MKYVCTPSVEAQNKKRADDRAKAHADPERPILCDHCGCNWFESGGRHSVMYANTHDGGVAFKFCSNNCAQEHGQEHNGGRESVAYDQVVKFGGYGPACLNQKFDRELLTQEQASAELAEAKRLWASNSNQVWGIQQFPMGDSQSWADYDDTMGGGFYDDEW